MKESEVRKRRGHLASPRDVDQILTAAAGWYGLPPEQRRQPLWQRLEAEIAAQLQRLKTKRRRYRPVRDDFVKDLTKWQALSPHQRIQPRWQRREPGLAVEARMVMMENSQPIGGNLERCIDNLLGYFWRRLFNAGLPTHPRWGLPEPDLPARFVMVKEREGIASARQGREIERLVERVQVLQPGTTDILIEMTVTNEHRARWPKAYQAFLAEDAEAVRAMAALSASVEDDAERVAREAEIIARLDAEMAEDIARERRRVEEAKSA